MDNPDSRPPGVPTDARFGCSSPHRIRRLRSLANTVDRAFLRWPKERSRRETAETPWDAPYGAIRRQRELSRRPSLAFFDQQFLAKMLVQEDRFRKRTPVPIRIAAHRDHLGRHADRDLL